jgi:uncharacterized protein YndB with AHSA1/START domain
MKKWLLRIAILVTVPASALWLFSPYRHHKGFAYKLVANTVEIDVSADSVFRFLGNSANASKWSVFVDHISTLNGDEVPDGSIGSRRRCYRNADETGTQWDEVITEVVPAKKRQISCYNMQHFTMSADGLGTEQLYEPIGSHRCRLTFTLFFLSKEPGLWDGIKTTIAAYRVSSIFQRNMNNIKQVVEHGRKTIM